MNRRNRCALAYSVRQVLAKEKVFPPFGIKVLKLSIKGWNSIKIKKVWKMFVRWIIQIKIRIHLVRKFLLHILNFCSLVASALAKLILPSHIERLRNR